VEAASTFLKTLGPARLGAMGAVAAILIGVFAVIALRAAQPVMAPLFTDLTLVDSAAVVKEVEALGIPFEIKADGASILVPREEVARLRMKLAEEGLPAGGVVGYEIFDKGSTLGATSVVQNINRLRALEGELARSIKALARVEFARVHLVLPERQLFSRETQEPTASIMLKVKGVLDGGQIRAVQHLVSSAVPNLKPGRVSIVDEAGRLLAAGQGEDNALVPGGAEERTLGLERRLREEVEDIVSRVVGPGRARVQVRAELDLNRVTQTSDSFDPETRVVRSTQTREENSESNDAAQEGGVSVGNELPGAAPGGEAAPRSRERNSKSEETVNYEISRTTKTEVTEAGRLKRLSVAVLLDGVYSRDAAGNLVYEPRPEADVNRIAALVRSAVGYSEARGDTVEVVNLRFAELGTSAQGTAAGEPGWLEQPSIMRLVEMAVLAVLAVLVVFVVLRPLVRKILAESPGIAALGAPHSQLALASPDAGVHAPLAEGENRTAKMVEIAELASRMHAASVQKVGELIEEHPKEALAIIRQWMQEPA